MPIFIQYFCNIPKRYDLWLILWKMKYLYTMKNKNILVPNSYYRWPKRMYPS